MSKSYTVKLFCAIISLLVSGSREDSVGTSQSLGTARNPALSCEQIKEASDVPSDLYYIQGGSRTFQKVSYFC